MPTIAALNSKPACQMNWLRPLSLDLSLSARMVTSVDQPATMIPPQRCQKISSPESDYSAANAQPMVQAAMEPTEPISRHQKAISRKFPLNNQLSTTNSAPTVNNAMGK